jgi:hypothetical protein
MSGVVGNAPKVLRALGCAATTSAAPQSPQNLSPGSLRAPQEGHACCSAWPQWTQNFRPSRLSFLQLVQRISLSAEPNHRRFLYRAYVVKAFPNGL